MRSTRTRQRRQKSCPCLGDLALSFGKFRGQRFRDIPKSYLEWVARTEGIPKTDRCYWRKIRLDSL